MRREGRRAANAHQPTPPSNLIKVNMRLVLPPYGGFVVGGNTATNMVPSKLAYVHTAITSWHKKRGDETRMPGCCFTVDHYMICQNADCGEVLCGAHTLMAFRVDGAKRYCCAACARFYHEAKDLFIDPTGLRNLRTLDMRSSTRELFHLEYCKSTSRLGSQRAFITNMHAIRVLVQTVKMDSA
jgi:hypothetical protein